MILLVFPEPTVFFLYFDYFLAFKQMFCLELGSKTNRKIQNRVKILTKKEINELKSDVDKKNKLAIK